MTTCNVEMKVPYWTVNFLSSGPQHDKLTQGHKHIENRLRWRFTIQLCGNEEAARFGVAEPEKEGV